MATTRLLTVEDVLAMDDDGYRYELIDGELERMPPGGGEHSEVGVEFIAALRDYARRTATGKTFGPDMGYVLGTDPTVMVAPDASFVRVDRLPPRDQRAALFALAPDLAVEVLSPSDRPSAVARKIARYLAAGVRLVWLADPAARTVAVHRPDRPPRLLTAADTLDGADVLPGFRLPVAALFPTD